MEQVVIYTQDNCQSCKMAKMVMDNEGIPYEEAYINTEEEREEFKAKGYMSTPVIEAGDKVITGFKPAEIKGLKE